VSIERGEPMSATNIPELKGVIPAIITSMDETGKVEYGLLEKQAAYLSDAGVHGFFIGGTTGEGAYLSTDEKREIFRVVREITQGRQLMCAAYICPSTCMVLEEMKALEKTEPDFIVAVTPYYMGMRQQDLVEHFEIIAREAPAPLVLYNIPGNTHNPMKLETILGLATEKNIAGIKDSSGDFMQFSRGLLGDAPKGFSWIQGEDYLDAASLMLGCDGIVSDLCNTRIEPYMEMWEAAQKKDWETMRSCQARINRLYDIIRLCDTPIASIKAAVEISGRGSRWMRHRSQSLTDDQKHAIEKILREF
jgi:4-hydroxy-tetrahydrodipicolinate synthase